MKKVLLGLAFALICLPVGNVQAITSEQKDAISDYCNEIKADLGKVQKNDARARVYLGGYFETILTSFMMPLNIRMVENNLSSPGLIENQSKMAEAKTAFVDDYVAYQQKLEELTGMDCKKEPEKFYARLVDVRARRKKVEGDVTKMSGLVSSHIVLVNELKGRL